MKMFGLLKHAEGGAGKYYTSELLYYKGPLDSYACPDQSKGNRKNQSTFLCGKNIPKFCNFTGKSNMCPYSFSFLAQKGLFLPPL